GANSLGSGWWQSHWWGSFYVSGSGNWIYHYPLGWMYQATETPSSVWFWNSKRGWLWTTSRIFPYLYEYGDGSNSNWLYYLADQNVFLEKVPNGWSVKE
ncbi:MAG: hypothetical protein VCA36_00550, partial [Opitutales bacterium]